MAPASSKANPPEPPPSRPLVVCALTSPPRQRPAPPPLAGTVSSPAGVGLGSPEMTHPAPPLAPSGPPSAGHARGPAGGPNKGSGGVESAAKSGEGGAGPLGADMTVSSKQFLSCSPDHSGHGEGNAPSFFDSPDVGEAVGVGSLVGEVLGEGGEASQSKQNLGRFHPDCARKVFDRLPLRPKVGGKTNVMVGDASIAIKESSADTGQGLVGVSPPNPSSSPTAYLAQPAQNAYLAQFVLSSGAALEAIPPGSMVSTTNVGGGDTLGGPKEPPIATVRDLVGGSPSFRASTPHACPAGPARSAYSAEVDRGAAASPSTPALQGTRKMGVI